MCGFKSHLLHQRCIIRTSSFRPEKGFGLLLSGYFLIEVPVNLLYDGHSPGGFLKAARNGAAADRRTRKYEREVCSVNCQEAEKLIVPYINNELSPMELEDFMEHLEGCESCREELEIHYMVDVGLKQLDEDNAVYDIVGDLRRKIEDSMRTLRRYFLLQIARYAVGTLAGMALAVTVLLQFRLWAQSGFLFF